MGMQHKTGKLILMYLWQIFKIFCLEMPRGIWNKLKEIVYSDGTIIIKKKSRTVNKDSRTCG